MITLEHVNKIYQLSADVRVEALMDINLVIHEHEDIAIIGKSGSGKSTLMNMITCIDPISDGEYYLNGVDVKRQSRSNLAILRNQNFGLFIRILIY